VRGAARAELGEVFARVLEERVPDASQAQLDRERMKPMRAPLIIAVCAIVDPQARIPVIEQVLSAGAAAQNICVAAHALGYGAAWKTGEAAYDPAIKAALGLEAKDAIVGFIYLGTPAQPVPRPQPVDPRQFVVEWRGSE
jgi:nitroreductase